MSSVTRACCHCMCLEFGNDGSKMNGLKAIMSNLDKTFFALKVVPALIRQKCDLSMQCFRLALPHDFQPVCIQSPGVILAIDLRQIKDRERNSWIRSPVQI